MQQFKAKKKKKKKNPLQIIYFIPLPSLKKFGRRCWESLISEIILRNYFNKHLT